MQCVVLFTAASYNQVRFVLGITLCKGLDQQVEPFVMNQSSQSKNVGPGVLIRSFVLESSWVDTVVNDVTLVRNRGFNLSCLIKQVTGYGDYGVCLCQNCSELVKRALRCFWIVCSIFGRLSIDDPLDVVAVKRDN